MVDPDAVDWYFVPSLGEPAHLGAVSSAVEHCLHTAGVAGSNPAPPTK